MRATLRWKMPLLAGLVLTGSSALAQNAPDAASSSKPATDGIGPQELQNFSLPGSVTKPADPQSPSEGPAPSPSVAPRAEAGRSNVARAAPRPLTRASEERPRIARTAEPTRSPAVDAKRSDPFQASFGPSPLPPPRGGRAGLTGGSQESAFAQAPLGRVSTRIAPEHKLLIWPWLLAAFALAGAALLLLRRRHHHESLATHRQINPFMPPEPAPVPPSLAPSPRSAPPAVAPKSYPPPPASVPPAKTGIISTRLRPVLEVGVQPLRCLVEDERIVLEFELELFNSGTAPARSVIAEASLFNAGIAQDQELARFYENPVGAGEGLEAIPPMKRVNFINQVVAPRSAIQEYELGGRKVFVPILAFNALYTWSGGNAQSSVAYLIGRHTPSGKLGPLSFEGGAREVGKLAARLLPTERQT